MAKMCTGPVDTYRAQELAKLTSPVVPLQRLKIQDDTFLEVQKNKPEAEVPAPSPKIGKTDLYIKNGNYYFIFTKFTSGKH